MSKPHYGISAGGIFFLSVVAAELCLSHRVDFSTFVLSGTIAIVIASLTISFQAAKAALAIQ